MSNMNRQKIKKFHVNINTRILLYFLFTTILPLAILALSSTFLIQHSLNEKSEQELSERVEAFQKIYIKRFNDFKDIANTDDFNILTKSINENNKNQTNKIIHKIKNEHKLGYAVLFDKELKRINSVSNNETIIMYPGKAFDNGLLKMLGSAFNGEDIKSSELLEPENLSYLGIKNKLVFKGADKNKNGYAVLSQITVIPIFKENAANEKNDNSNLAVSNIINDPLNNNETKNTESETDLLDIIKKNEVIACLVVGNFVNSNSYLDLLLNDFPNIPVNIIQSNTIISTNISIPFNITELESIKSEQILSSKNYRGEQFINNQWYKIATEPINNFNGDTIATVIVGLQEDIFRSLKLKNSLLILQVSLLVACGGLILAFLLSKSISEPISKMVDAVRAIESGKKYSELEIPAEDELGELALSINEMSEALEARENQIITYNKILMDQKTKLESIFNFSADGIMTLDENKRIASINPVISRWLGKDEDYAIGKYFHEVIEFYDDPTVFAKKKVKVEDLDDITQVNKYFPNAKINYVDLEISYSPIVVEENNIISYVLILRDITKRKETEELRENFIATLTHDLRVPLLAGVHTLEYLLNGSYGDLTDSQIYITQQVIKSNEDLLRMVNTLLDTYSYESGKHSLVKREINLNKLINECLNGLKHLADDKNHKFVFDPNYPIFLVIADKQELKRVIMNLLSNALIHTSEKGIIEIILASQDENVVVTIKDNGVGISENDIKIIFERYVRGGKTLRKVGTGLGLYLSKHIIEAHGGKIWVESKMKEGSAFSFTLPLSKKGSNNE